MTAFLANENISKAAVGFLRESGHDVRWIAEDFPSIKDEVVIDLAAIENRIIVTFDRDYGELIFNKGTRRPKGVVYVRLKEFTPEAPAALILRYLSISPSIFDGYFNVLTESGIRRKKL
jgi:predicted nuclease of predicted toxin-antitoxin system